MGVEKSISTRHERREGFIYDPVEDRVVHEITDKLSEYNAYSELSSVNPQYYLINGEGGPTQYYVFTLILLNNTQLPSGGITRNTYLGYYVYSTTIYIRANTTDPSRGSRLIVEVKLVNTTTGRVINTRTYTYYLGSTPVSITLYPSIPLTEGGINITISLKYDYSLAPPYVAIATLQFIKMYKNMPTPQTVKPAVRILSTGLHHYYKLGMVILPTTPRIEKYVHFWGRGYGFYRERNSVTIDTGALNGMYYDVVDPKAWLRIDIGGTLFPGLRVQNLTAIIKIKINGILYKQINLTIPPCSDLPSYSCNYSYAQVDIPLPLNTIEGNGPLITIERTLVPEKSDEGWSLYNWSSVLFDAMIEYWYAPEVVSETNWIKWGYGRFPWYKLEMHIPIADNIAGGKASLVFDGSAIGIIDSEGYVSKLYVVEDTSIVTLELRIATSLDVRGFGCNIIKFEGQSYEQYVGAAVTGWSILYTGLELAQLVGIISIPEPVSKLLFVADLAMAIVSSSKEQTTSYQDGIWYVCK
jgi:hypothetical protein